VRGSASVCGGRRHRGLRSKHRHRQFDASTARALEMSAAATRLSYEHGVTTTKSALGVGSAWLKATLVPVLSTAHLTNEYLPFHDGVAACTGKAGVPKIASAMPPSSAAR
jgi:hypothetical protein